MHNCAILLQSIYCREATLACRDKVFYYNNLCALWEISLYLRSKTPLKGDLQGFWSRRIDEKNRLVYNQAVDGALCIVACRGHYES
ncbi:MAG: type II toxin-antitoxin system YoeB family toxin [Candidatus Egerieousia sp.]|nr:type II toxin-antitoxin system YoeB family toxin [Candidatus Egerieousia sp.]